MKKYLLILTLAFVAGLSSCTKKEVVIQSPDGAYQMVVSPKNGLTNLQYTVLYNGTKIIKSSGLGLDIEGYTLNANPVFISEVVNSFEDKFWSPLFGETNEYQDKYNQVVISLKGENGNFLPYEFVVRAYNEGLAFRYEFNGEDEVHIVKENTSFKLPDETDLWVSKKAQTRIYRTKIADLKDTVDRPVVGRIAEKKYVAIGEAALVDYARMKLSPDKQQRNTLVSTLCSDVIKTGTFSTPWRTIMAGSSTAELLQNNGLFLNLNEPNKLEDTSWIKPGKVLREVTLTNQGAIASIDFAKKHNFQYVEFDAGWYGHEYDSISDASTVTVDPKRSKGPFDLPKIIEYANKNEIGVIVYINHLAMEKQLDQVLPLYKSWGIKGVKYGFVNVGSQYWTNWLHEAVVKAAENQLMVDIHDEYRPTGFSRTYPNLITQEGIRGDEATPSTKHTLETLFTRSLLGAADNTFCYMAPRVTEKMGGRAAQLAKSVLFYSPWQFLYWYDRPKESPHKAAGAGSAETIIPETPELDFWDVLPTTWDDTKVIEGEIGEHALIARKKGNDWFVGGLSTNKRTFNFPLNFLDKGKEYTATIYYDDERKAETNGVGIRTIAVNNTTVFEEQVQKTKGFAIHIVAM